MNCNGADDDCDGVPDVGCPCADGERRPCYGGPAGTRGVGLCTDGVTICAGGVLGAECLEDVLPADEFCNDRDDDCDGLVDDGVRPRFYRDDDGDNFGQTAVFIDDQCSAPPGFAAGANDCDDTNPARFPGADDICNLIDDDCDGVDDESAPPITYYRDGDGDGFGDMSMQLRVCGAPLGYVPVAGDCDDTRPFVSPVGLEQCDAAAVPLDEDCDGSANEGCACVDGETRACGGGTPLRGACRAGVQRCIAGAWAGCSGNIDPGTLTETCNGLDDDCDGLTDETLLAAGCYLDADSDGFGSGAVLTTLCADASRTAVGSCPSGYTNAGGTSTTTDCNDANGTVRPGGTEACNGVDDDCDGMTDEGVTRTYYRDADGDGFGALAMPATGCTAPAGFVAASGDCDDTRAGSSPVGVEICDATMRDENCNSTANEGCACVDGAMQACGGGSPIRGACRAGLQRCIGGVWGGCSGNIDPGTLIETCNMVDDDCDGMTDESLLATACFLDADSDGYGTGSSAITTLCRDMTRASFGECPSGYTNVGATAATRDCNDGNGAIRPMGTEVCNATDDDCDGLTDEGVTTSYFRDADGDGFGAGTATVGCTAPTGYVANGTDCDDTRASVSPSGTEICDATMRDDDCDSTANEGCACIDGSARACGGGSPIRGVCRAGTQLCIAGAWASCSGNIDPGTLTESCNGLDDDCDGLTDETLLATSCYVDADSDGAGIGTAITTLCADPSRTAFMGCPSGYSNVAGDCNDSNAARSPTRTETCNGLDDDCNGIADNGFLCVFGTARAGTGTFGACTTAGSVSGTYICGPTCTSETFSPTLPTETCNATDDDCDGIVDDGYACVRNSAGNACTTACGTPGTFTCTAACGVPTASTACAAAVETCNGCDDDRDGTIDEGLDADGVDPCYQGQTRSCTTLTGVAGGTQICRGDCRGWDACRTADEGTGVAGTCNAADDDGDGLIDEGFACAQNSITACSLTSTAPSPAVANTYPIVCGTVTNGRRRCNTDCTYLDAACYTATEVCNYCEDDGDPVTTTDASIATAIVSDSFACNELTVSGGPTCGNFGAPGSDVGVRLVSAGTMAAPLFSQSGALWTRSATLTQSRPYVGWGPLTFLVQAQVTRGTTTYPADGWSVVLARTGTGDRDTGYTGSVGTPRSRPNSLSVEWRFFTGALATEADQVSVVVTDASGARTTLGTVVPPAAVHLNSTTSGTINQTLIITYTPDDPRTLFRDDRFELRFNTTDPSPAVAYEMPTSLGGATTSTSCVGTCTTPAAFGRHLEPGYPFELGVTAATGGSNAFVRVTTALGLSAISGVIPLRVDREDVCF
jgi:hypothetical protein